MMQKMFSAALAWLSVRDFSVFEMQEKLKKKFPLSTFDEKKNVIDALLKEKLLDDKRFAENFVRYKTEYGQKGKRMIEMELRKKGIFEFDSTDALQMYDEKKELECAFSLAKRKKENLGEVGESVEIAKQKGKIARFLAGRGFSSSIIWETIDEVFKKTP